MLFRSGHELLFGAAVFLELHGQVPALMRVVVVGEEVGAPLPPLPELVLPLGSHLQRQVPEVVRQPTTIILTGIAFPSSRIRILAPKLQDLLFDRVLNQRPLRNIIWNFQGGLLPNLSKAMTCDSNRLFNRGIDLMNMLQIDLILNYLAIQLTILNKIDYFLSTKIIFCICHAFFAFIF